MFFLLPGRHFLHLFQAIPKLSLVDIIVHILCFSYQMHYSNEVVSRLHQLYKEQFPEEERDDKKWDLSVSEMKQVRWYTVTVCWNSAHDFT